MTEDNITSNPTTSKTNANIHPVYSRDFLQKGLNIALDFLQSSSLSSLDQSQQPQSESELKQQQQQKDQHLHKIDLSIKENAKKSNEEMLQLISNVLAKQKSQYSSNSSSSLKNSAELQPQSQQKRLYDPNAMLGAMTAPVINGSVYTYEVAPCFTLMEYEIYELFRKILGWNAIDGIFTPGGSVANYMAITTSRYRFNPDSKKQGSQSMKIFSSEGSPSFSMKKGAVFCGVGLDNLISVGVDSHGRMIPEELERQILQLKKKQTINNENNESLKSCILVNVAVAVTGGASQSKDSKKLMLNPIHKIGEICKKHNIWLHVDCCTQGGAAIHFGRNWQQTQLSRQTLFQNVDSISIDTHSTLPIPLQLSMFLTKKENTLFSANSAKADYLFHKQRASYDGNLDIGDKSFQCGRVIDILKFWTFLKGKGLKAIAKEVDELYYWQ